MPLNKFAILIISLLPLATFPNVCNAASKPNIIIVLCDDVGYSDIGCYGSEIPTPRLDQLAENGIRFTDFYNASRCCPSRAALLTGLYPHQAGIGHMLERTSNPGYSDNLSSDSVTIAEVLQKQGYKTYMTGKWHVGKTTLPLDRGFQKFYGTVAGGGDYFNPEQLYRDRTPISATDDSAYRPAHYYYTDAITDHSVKFLHDHHTSSPATPFLLYVAYTAAHFPIQAPEDEIGKHRGRYDGGYDAVRMERLKKQKTLKLIPPDFEISKTVGSWKDVSDLSFETRLMETYAAMITRMDTGIGKIIDELKATNQLDNTLIVFMSDNGACAEKSKLRTNGTKTRKLQTYGQNWANVSNAPFRQYKSWTHEGGIASPFIVHWPAAIPKSRNNTLERNPGHLIDIAPTLFEASGTTYPTHYNGNSLAPLAGQSLLPLIKGQEFKRTNALFWEHERKRAVRDGDWKLVKQDDKPWELYNLATDRRETKNLAGEFPERIEQMSQDWLTWARKNDVLPLGAWRKKSK